MSDEQRLLGFYDPAPLAPTDPNVDQRDVPRLSGQIKAILERLQLGPATSSQLSRLSLKYTSRISDLRKHGYVIGAKRLDSGEHLYTLET